MFTSTGRRWSSGPLLSNRPFGPKQAFRCPRNVNLYLSEDGGPHKLTLLVLEGRYALMFKTFGDLSERSAGQLPKPCQGLANMNPGGSADFDKADLWGTDACAVLLQPSKELDPWELEACAVLLQPPSEQGDGSPQDSQAGVQPGLSQSHHPADSDDGLAEIDVQGRNPLQYQDTFTSHVLLGPAPGLIDSIQPACCAATKLPGSSNSLMQGAKRKADQSTSKHTSERKLLPAAAEGAASWPPKLKAICNDVSIYSCVQQMRVCLPASSPQMCSRCHTHLAEAYIFIC